MGRRPPKSKMPALPGGRRSQGAAGPNLSLVRSQEAFSFLISHEAQVGNGGFPGRRLPGSAGILPHGPPAGWKPVFPGRRRPQPELVCTQDFPYVKSCSCAEISIFRVGRRHHLLREAGRDVRRSQTEARRLVAPTAHRTGPRGQPEDIAVGSISDGGASPHRPRPVRYRPRLGGTRRGRAGPPRRPGRNAGHERQGGR